MDNVKPYTSELLSHKRMVADMAADSFIERCFAGAESKALLYAWLKQLDKNVALKQIPFGYQHESFMMNSLVLPGWADTALMKKGSAFFIKHAEHILRLLGLLSLPYCYAAADGAMVLYLSQRLKADAGKRLADTAQFIWDVMAPNAFTDQGSGFASILKVRLTHAAARYYTLRSGKWDAALAAPINQEDMAGTNLSFSLIVIRGLRKSGYSISYTEQQCFMHLWNVIGHMLGLDDELIPQSGKSAHALELAIRQRHFRPSVHGRELTRALINYFSGSANAGISAKDTQQLMRYLLGNQLADLLGIPPSPAPFYLPVVLKVAAKIPSFGLGSSLNVLYQEKYKAFSRQQAEAGKSHQFS